MIVCHEHFQHMTCLISLKFAFTGGTGVYKTLIRYKLQFSLWCLWVCSITAVSLWAGG